MEEREVVDIFGNFLQNHNQLLRLFRTLSNRLQNDNYFIVIKADKVPYREHAGTYNVPTVNLVAVVMAGDSCERRDIRIQRRDNAMQIIQQSSFLRCTAVSVDILGRRRWISFKY